MMDYERRVRNEVTNYTIDRLEDLKDWYDTDMADLHNELFNTDYYIIGTYQAKKWLGEDVLDIIGDITEYEENTFGEVNTDLTQAESIVNMYVYIVGERILWGLNSYTDNDCTMATPEIIQSLIDELKE